MTRLIYNRMWVWATVASFVLVSLYISLPCGPPSSSRLRQVVQKSADERCMEAAGNRTLGFHSIHSLNLPHRTDRSDAMMLQAYLSGIDIKPFLGVYENDIKKNGLPPSRNTAPKKPRMREIACWRAHANVWAMMLEKRIPAAIVMEADATWELGIRPIMAEVNHHFRRLLRQSAPAPLYKAASNDAFDSNPDDPWMTEHWDVLAIGHCEGTYDAALPEVRYQSQYASEGPIRWKGGVTLRGERMIHRAKGMICTAGYAVTLRGAAKMLLRTSYNMDAPVDNIMNDMADRGELVLYNVVQPPVNQWKYLDNIGRDGGSSDINAQYAKKGAERSRMDGWEKAEESHSVWVSTGFDHTGRLKNGALEHAWKHIFSNEKIDKW